MANYVSPSIKYYRVNANNTALAQSSSGGASNAPTEEITAPVATGGTFASYDSNTYEIAGNSPADFNDFAVNQYLYYTDTTTGYYVLVGQIDTITDATHLTLSAAAVNIPDANSVLSAAYALITNNESIYMRIQTGTGAPNGQMYIPNFGLGYWRLNNGLTGVNNPAQSTLEQISPVGTPLQNATATPISFTFITMNQFPVATTGGLAGPTYWSSTGSFPTYIWIKITPQVGTSTSLASQTLYRFTTQESMEALTIQVQTPGSTLRNAGYNNVSTGTTTVGTETAGG